MRADRLVLPEAFVRRLAQRVLPARQAQVYLLRWYGDERAPSYSCFALAKQLDMARMTVWRECERAQERLQPLLLAEAAKRQARARARVLTQNAAPAPPEPPEQERCVVTVKWGQESQTCTRETEQCALTGQHPQRSRWKMPGG